MPENTISTYLKELKNQINENPLLSYVILTLHNDNEVNELSNLLTEKNTIKYILNNFHTEKYIIDDKYDSWSLCITGFKFGAKINSPRKIGLLAYRANVLFNFKTFIFYNSESYSKYNTEPIQRDVIVNNIINNVQSYLENNTNFNSNFNYIKPAKKQPKKITNKKQPEKITNKKQPKKITTKKQSKKKIQTKNN